MGGDGGQTCALGPDLGVSEEIVGFHITAEEERQNKESPNRSAENNVRVTRQ